MAFINKSNIEQIKTHKTSFNKKDLVLGSIIMFEDNTFGVYIPAKNFDLVKSINNLDLDFDSFIAYNVDHRNRPEKPFLISTDNYDDNLYHVKNTIKTSFSRGIDIIRVYYDVLSKKELNSSFLQDFGFNIENFVKNKRYIKRQPWHS